MQEWGKWAIYHFSHCKEKANFTPDYNQLHYHNAQLHVELRGRRVCVACNEVAPVGKLRCVPRWVSHLVGLTVHHGRKLKQPQHSEDLYQPRTLYNLAGRPTWAVVVVHKGMPLHLPQSANLSVVTHAVHHPQQGEHVEGNAVDFSLG